MVTDETKNMETPTPPRFLKTPPAGKMIIPSACIYTVMIQHDTYRHSV